MNLKPNIFRINTKLIFTAIAVLVIIAIVALVFINNKDSVSESNSKQNLSQDFLGLVEKMKFMDSLYQEKDEYFFQSELENFTKTEQDWKKNLSDIEYAKICEWIYDSYESLGEIKKAVPYAEKSLRHIDSSKNKFYYAETLNDLGTSYSQLENFDRATSVYFQGLDVLKNDTLNENYSTLTTNLGNLYRDTGDFNLAIEFYNRTYRVIEAIENNDTIPNINVEYAYFHGNIGYAYTLMKDLDKANFHFEKARSKFKEKNLQEEANLITTVLASNYVDQGKLKTAETMLTGILEDAEHNEHWEVYVETCISLFKLYIEKGNNEKAYNIIAQGFDKIGSSNNARLKMKIYETKAEHFRNIQDYKKAFENLEQEIQLKDSVFDITQNEMLRELSVKYQTDRKNDQIQQLEVINSKEKRIKQIYLFGLLLVFLVLIFIFTLLRRISEQKKALQQANQTKDQLFSIIAHDLRSPMLALQGMGDLIHYYIQKKDEEKLLNLGEQTKSALGRINHLLQNLLEWALANKNQINFNPESLEISKLVQDNLKLIETMSFAKQIKISTEIEHHNLMLDKAMMSTVIRNILSNAIRFSPAESEIKISGKIKTDSYLLSIEDQAGGIPEDILKKLKLNDEQLVTGEGKDSVGLGLQLIKLFVKKNQGRLEINATETGTLIKIYLPLPNRGDIKSSQ